MFSFYRKLLLILFVISPCMYATEQNPTEQNNCGIAGFGQGRPREIHPARTFDALVNWIHDDLIVNRKAPGLVVGISGTDSILAFLAAARAFEKAGRPERTVGIHFAGNEPSEFEREIIPWLQKMAPQSPILVDRSIDHRRDGLRWGALLDWSVIHDPNSGIMRPPQERFWVVGTRNASEESYQNYSNVSNAASVQVISHLWKSEVLQLCIHLGVPESAVAKSCQADCACGRAELAALYIPEVDALLMERAGEVSADYIAKNIPAKLRQELSSYIDTQIQTNGFKQNLPVV